ncbi:MAG TPA: hypothetical protein VGZ00_07105 [Candidatus Baltobacteraceae bacterium]|jgi:2-polyprenyl-3-methyl-5-hydroxy-6-metoxy-1,4-benzoquinol methylase|nr:hypothetical protein [Candidatus Baltobacteraceae bacterium]
MMPEEPLNFYGDTFIPTTGQHGGSISEQRIDELDQACLDFVKSLMSEKKLCQAVDIGGGSGAQSKRMAMLEASVLLIDFTNQEQSIAEFNRSLSRPAIRFLQRDVRDINDEEWPTPIHCVYSQRMLGCITYQDTLQLLTFLKSKSSSDALFFLSTAGLDTEYGADYPDRDKPVERRFAHLLPNMAAKHGIYAPECLYRERDLRQIVEQAGLVSLRSWTSTFGNPKIIARMS